MWSVKVIGWYFFENRNSIVKSKVQRSWYLGCRFVETKSYLPTKNDRTQSYLLPYYPYFHVIKYPTIFKWISWEVISNPFRRPMPMASRRIWLQTSLHLAIPYLIILVASVVAFCVLKLNVWCEPPYVFGEMNEFVHRNSFQMILMPPFIIAVNRDYFHHPSK